MKEIAWTCAVPVAQETEVLVVGGGPAGIAAALASARSGVRTMLVERYGFLGGSATAGLVGPFMTSYSLDGQTQIIKGIFDELVRRMEQRGGALHPEKVRAGSAFAGYIWHGHDHVTPFDPETFKVVAVEMLLEAGVTLVLHSLFVEAIKEENRVTGAIFANKSGLMGIESKIVVDCTGDGDVAWRAGVPMRQGREEDGLTQPMTLFFRVGSVDDAQVEKWVREHPEENGKLFRSLVEEARNSGEFHIPREKIGIYRLPQPGVWRVNTTRIQRLDGTRVEDLTKAELEGRRQVMELMAFFHKRLPGFQNAQLLDTAAQVGVRESRRIVGEYILTQEDLTIPTSFHDTIACCAYPIDLHSPTDAGGGCRADIKTANVYEIPYRCLVPVEVDGLLAAGRNVSATHEALGAIRVMPPVFAMGQAAGTAAALAAREGSEPREVDLAELRTALLEQGVYLP